ncbi:polysaccharide pyruvyl transferase WcaK-like protein [Citricoccus muralis]|uniref:Polysaccharide pyruvyl transferase WcaK-like protein n=2 Tax=Citricoccus muralis TaxID=169134 RepID=A0A3D9LDM1_9MICC|nr:polysaccharide pyruvyl transferase WcaK-like protein [Citricoccus muralis]
MILLGEAGNYGDDLILISVLHSISKTFPESKATFLSFGNPIPLEEVRQHISLPRELKRVAPVRDWPWSRALQENFAEADVMIVGGGGLIQTWQHSLKPYQWLRHLPDTPAPVIGVGLGLGPVSKDWVQYFRKHDSPFDVLHVRDRQSQELALDFGWNAEIAADFIDEHFLEQLITPMRPKAPSNSLGVALRAWPGLSAQELASHIESVQAQHEIDVVKFFVLESKAGRGPDVEFTHQVATLLASTATEIHIYTSDNIVDFTQEICSTRIAISMKLHSSAVWGYLGVPMYPIVYAPKISSYFGVPYTGLSVFKETVDPAPHSDYPRSEDALTQALNTLGSISAPVQRTTFTPASRLRFQLKGLVIDGTNKIRRSLRRR